MEQGVPYRIKVGTHCGFGPIDFDGSFFEADPGSALTADLPDPEDIGEISLEGENMALYISSTGANITLTRLDAEYVDLPVCE